MKTKIVYALASGQSDIYLPQFMISAYSARMSNPDAVISLVVDADTRNVINDQFPSALKLISDLVVIDVPMELNQMQKSRFLKTKMRESIEGDFLYIDTDTVICDDLSEIDNCPFKVAAVIDRHSIVSEHLYVKKITEDISKVGLDIDSLNNKYFNGGVLYVKDSPIAYRLFSEWNMIWNESRLSGVSIDQPGLAKANILCGYPIQELNGVWNCQLADNFMNYLSAAKILHYFASNGSSPYLMYDKKFYFEIIDAGEVTEDIKKLLLTPKSLFVNNSIILCGKDCSIVNTTLFDVFKYKHKIFDFIEKLFRICLAVDKNN